MGYPLWKKEKKTKSCSPYLSNKAGKQNIKYVVVAEAAKTGSYKLKAEKMAARIKTRQDSLLLPTPIASLLGGSCPSTPLPRPWVNAVRTSNFQIHTMRGWGKKDYEGVADNEGMQREETKGKQGVGQHQWLKSTAAVARQPPHRVQRRKEIPSPCSQAVECLLLYRLFWEAGAVWIHQETSYLQDP